MQTFHLPPETRHSPLVTHHSDRPAVVAFTLIELLIVIAIIAILAGLAFPAVQGALDSGKKAQARNDLQQIVMAVKAYQLEYGKLPLLSESASSGDVPTNNSHLFNVLRGTGNEGEDKDMNPRKIAFIEPKVSKARKGGLGIDNGIFYDPWGTPYQIRMDHNYDNQIQNFYTGNSAGWDTLNYAVIAASAGPDAKFGTNSSKSSTDAKDDIISWQ